MMLKQPLSQFISGLGERGFITSRNGGPLLRKVLASVPGRINGQLPGTAEMPEKAVHTTHKDRQRWQASYQHRQL